ncbi:hypothetical protein HII31_13036 [Pseudocercospora fuligena]|uniref:Uncharacterized protein n=1 Tax=Pseudocercospora fuligena TaxID=685502 RepID=A0A8H6R494_9PEZI|nr:hypothetical protein HII31_13036 [Pseudocercospora fuligena]
MSSGHVWRRRRNAFQQVGSRQVGKDTGQSKRKPQSRANAKNERPDKRRDTVVGIQDIADLAKKNAGTSDGGTTE